MRNNKPLVSVIVPVYNAADFLDKCLDSLLAQTFTDYEVVLVDDGSTDGSGDICDKYAAKHKQIVVVHKKNEGVAEARITGFKASCAPWIAFVDADDYVDHSFLKKMTDAAKENDTDMVVCRYFTCKHGKAPTVAKRVTGYFDRNGIDNFLKNKFLYDKNTGAAGMPVALWAKIIKREFVETALHAGKGLKWSEDMVGLFHILLNVKSFLAIDDALYFYVQHQGQVTKKYDILLWQNQLEALRRYRSLDSRNLLEEQLFLRYWVFNVKAITQRRMPKALDGKKAFCCEMRRLDQIPSWRDFITSRTYTSLGWRDDVMLWMLRLRFYGLYYNLFCKHQ